MSIMSDELKIAIICNKFLPLRGKPFLSPCMLPAVTLLAFPNSYQHFSNCQN